jgi:hypothetical protein
MTLQLGIKKLYQSLIGGYHSLPRSRGDRFLLHSHQRQFLCDPVQLQTLDANLNPAGHQWEGRILDFISNNKKGHETNGLLG